MKISVFVNARLLTALILAGFFCTMVHTNSIAQGRKAKNYDINIWQTSSLDTLQPRDPLTQEVMESLEKFTGPDDAVVYIYRLPAMLGAVAKWQVLWNDAVIGKLKQNDCVAAHINTKNQIQNFSYTGYETKFNFTNIKAHNYYFIEVKGMFITFGPLNAQALGKIKSCNNLSGGSD